MSTVVLFCHSEVTRPGQPGLSRATNLEVQACTIRIAAALLPTRPGNQTSGQTCKVTAAPHKRQEAATGVQAQKATHTTGGGGGGRRGGGGRCGGGGRGLGGGGEGLGGGGEGLGGGGEGFGGGGGGEGEGGGGDGLGGGGGGDGGGLQSSRAWGNERSMIVVGFPRQLPAGC